jgi:hypothetical protein
VILFVSDAVDTGNASLPVSMTPAMLDIIIGILQANINDTGEA